MRSWLTALLLLAACSTTPGSAPAKPASTPETAPPGTVSPKPQAAEPIDPRWRFFTTDTHRYASPWFAGRHRIMIGFGCTPAPYYDHDSRCPGGEGFHHGIDVAMPCGTGLFAGTAGHVLDPAAPGSPGSAYGPWAFRLRADGHDILIGHVRRVFVHPGQTLTQGQRIALASDAGAPDGCHLHFEVRPPGGGYADAVDPAPLLALSPQADRSLG